MTGWLDFVSKKCQTNIREIFVSGGPDKLEKTKKWILYFNFVATRYETETSLSKRFHFLRVRLGRVSTHLLFLHMSCLILHLVALVCVSGYWKLGIWGRVAPPLPPKLSEGVAAHPAACGGNQLQTSSVVSLVPPALEFDANGPCAPE